MGYIIPIKNRKDFIRATRVLDELPGEWQSRATENENVTVLLVLESHFEALVRAGVVPPIGASRRGRGKKLSTKKRHKDRIPKLKALIYAAEEGGYWAKVPGVPGCVSVGETLEEVKANILDALEGCLAVREEMARQEGQVVEEVVL